ncbi:MAG: tetratricopeptide repeat protein [Verrucomicrobia bacterium]|nr:tetratricopeptide repeat protein [Verrucomicrobiota bacterium]
MDESLSIELNPAAATRRRPRPLWAAAASLALCLALGWTPRALSQNAAPPTPAPPPANAPAAPLPPTPEETRAFEAARNAFQDRNYSVARKFFAEFVQQFPGSDRAAEAILIQARATLEQGEVESALKLLESSLPKGGRVADEYRYWMGVAHHSQGRFAAAAEQFGRLLKDHPASARRLEAAYGEARARFKLGEWSRVVELLRSPSGSFREAVKTRPKDDLATSGDLMLVEALLELRNYGEAETLARSLEGRKLTVELRWRIQQTLCRVLLESQRFPAALTQSSNAVLSARETGAPSAVAESLQIQAAILERLNQLAEAAQVYEKNLQPPTPLERQLEALLQLIRLHVARNQFNAATQRLELLLAQSAGGTNADVALITYGEIFLRQFLSAAKSEATNTTASVSTNVLNEATARFDQLLRAFPASRFTGLAHLYRGWALWSQERTSESQEAFRAALQALPFGEDQAMAQYKLAEVQFRLRDLTNAAVSFRAFIDRYAALPRIQNTLYDQALLHLIRVSFELKDGQGAAAAMEKFLSWNPNSALVDSGLLLMGRRLTLLDQPEKARDWLSKISEKSPQKDVAELAIARSFTQEGNWPMALARYSAWLNRFTNAPDLRPRAEFNQAWATYQSGAESNAYSLFTNFVALHPTNDLAPLAQFWIGDFYLRQLRYTNAEIQLYTNAEIQFRKIYQDTNRVPDELTYQARMQEGRAAFTRQGFNNAHEIFSQIVNEKPPYQDLVARAYFALADCLMSQAAISTNAFAKYAEAGKAYQNITFLYGTNPVAPKAWGNLGNCLLQLAQLQQYATSYQQATNAYQQAMAHPLATVADRSRAEVGLGIALRKMAENFTSPKERQPVLDLAQWHFQRVLYEKNVSNMEQPDRFWQRVAGLESGRLSESLQDWKAAVGTYERLKQILPQFSADMDKRIERARSDTGLPAAK